PQREPRPAGVAGLRLRLRHRAHRDAAPRLARPAHVLGERPESPGAVLVAASATSAVVCRLQSSAILRPRTRSYAPRTSESCVLASLAFRAAANDCCRGGDH